MATYEDWLKSQGISDASMYNDAIGNGLKTSYSNLGGDSMTISPIQDTGSGLGSSVTGYIGNQRLGDMASTAGVGFGIYDSLFGMGGKVAKENLANMKKQGTLLNQNIEANKASMENTNKFRNIMNNAGSTGLGSSLNKTAIV